MQLNNHPDRIKEFEGSIGDSSNPAYRRLTKDYLVAEHLFFWPNQPLLTALFNSMYSDLLQEQSVCRLPSSLTSLSSFSPVRYVCFCILLNCLSLHFVHEVVKALLD